MSNTFVQGLIITAIGMSMVFAALAMLWGLIALLARLRLPGRRAVTGVAPGLAFRLHEPPPEAQPSPQELAAIGAALALLQAEKEAEAGLSWRLPPILTRWVAVGYGRQLTPWQPPRARQGGDYPDSTSKKD